MRARIIIVIDPIFSIESKFQIQLNSSNGNDLFALAAVLQLQMIIRWNRRFAVNCIAPRSYE